MSARKLQQEMDRVFKRVSEGCAVFDSIYNKLQNSTNQSQKEKLEQDLKREIKKLQKLRDQIKTWIASNDVRDKKQLMEQRRLIENDMERFKAVEREVKTKAYSKEGLMRSNDPYAKEKQEATEFLLAKSEELEQQIEQLEEELDQLQNTNKKGKKDHSKQERINEIEHLVERHKWHIYKMELIISMVEVDKLAPESVMELQEDINYYVESNQEVDFAEDEALYDDLNLMGEDEHEIVETIVRDDTYTLEDLAQDLSKEAAKEAAQKEKEEKEREREREKNKEKSKETSNPPASASPQPSSMPSAEVKQENHVSSVPAMPDPLPSSTGSGLANGGGTHYNNGREIGRTPSPGRRSQSPSSSSINPLPPPSVPASKSAEPFRKNGHLAQGGATAPTPVSSAAGRVPFRETIGTPTPPGLVPSQINNSAGASMEPSQSSGSPTGNRIAPTSAGRVTKSSVFSSLDSLPPGLQDLIGCLDAAKQRLADPDAAFGVPSIAQLVHNSFMSTPDSLVSDIPRYYHPQNPYPTPDYYPQEALPSLEDMAVFREMHVDTLFYVFYYCQNTHQQYLAAKELKNRSWRFHKQFLTWFQRQEDPQLITPEYEEGTYRFFDFEGSWVQRRKTNFKFEFKYLENEI